MNHRAMTAAVLIAEALAVAGASGARGQDTQPAPTSMPTVNYTDAAFGFELELPAGWDYDRTRFQEFKNSLGLLRARDPGGRRSLQIIVFRSFDMKPFEDWIVDFGKASAELTNSERVDWETWKLPPRAGAILTFSSMLGAMPVRTHYLCVPFDPSTVWVLIYTGPAAGDDERRQVRREFDQVTATLRIHYDPEESARLTPALERGKALLEKLHAQAARVRLDETEYLYDFALAGKPVGYLQRRISREEYVFSGPQARKRYAKDGVRVRERSWRFAEDGTIWYVRVDLFTSFDGQSEMIENRQIQIPPPDIQPQQLVTRLDQVVREADALFSSYTTSRDKTLPDPSKPISVGPVYLDQAWERLLPGLLLGGSEEMHAVAIYSSETRSLLSHTIKPLGQRKLPGTDTPAYAFEVRDGFIGRPSRSYTDERGTLLRLEAGDLTLTRTPRESIEKKYAARRDEARKRFPSLPAD